MKFIFLILALSFTACSGLPGTSKNTIATQQNTRPAAPANEQAAGGKASATPAPANTGSPSAAKAACYAVDTGDNVVQKSQTFPVDFEPFKGSCFVTSYNPEYDDPPMETEYAIYKGGKKVFDFPERFNGATFGCWVEAVAFQDLNNDGLTDITVVGKCSAKAAPYNENMVYINTGKAFVTRPDGNNRLGDLKSAKEIADFVEDNKEIFFK
jgi:hypothetical protein